MDKNLESIKRCATMLLELDPVINEEYPFIVHHPFIESNPKGYVKDNGDFDAFDVNNRKDLKKFVKQRKKEINKANSFNDICIMINKPYQLLFFSLNKNFISKKEYNHNLKDIWLDTEFPNADKNVSVKDSLQLFKKSDPKLLMTLEERQYLEDLPDKVTIYRGTHDEKNSKALSWTTDYERAKWFATRFHEDGFVLTATINKKDIVAFFNARNENELIVDFNKIKNLNVEKILNISI